MAIPAAVRDAPSAPPAAAAMLETSEYLAVGAPEPPASGANDSACRPCRPSMAAPADPSCHAAPTMYMAVPRAAIAVGSHPSRG